MYSGNIIILGAPGSGKGTLGKQLSKEFNFHLISTGDILRSEKKSGSEIGKKINDILGKGNLVPDEIVNDIVKNKIKSIDRFILDGFPRTVIQGEFLDKISDIELVIYLDVSDDTIKKRILERGKTSGREDDQKIEIIERRIVQYKSETKPLIDFYSNKKILSTVDGEESIDNVFNQVKTILKLWQ